VQSHRLFHAFPHGRQAISLLLAARMARQIVGLVAMFVCNSSGTAPHRNRHNVRSGLLQLVHAVDRSWCYVRVWTADDVTHIVYLVWSS
jgi:hypothetical protein